MDGFSVLYSLIFCSFGPKFDMIPDNKKKKKKISSKFIGSELWLSSCRHHFQPMKRQVYSSFGADLLVFGRIFASVIDGFCLIFLGILLFWDVLLAWMKIVVSSHRSPSRRDFLFLLQKHLEKYPKSAEHWKMLESNFFHSYTLWSKISVP